MADAISHAHITSIHATERLYNAATLVTAALFAAALIIVAAHAFLGGPGPINPDLVLAYP
jgi:hypothetical protein